MARRSSPVRRPPSSRPAALAPRAAALGGAPLRWTIGHRWDGAAARADEIVHCQLRATATGLRWSIDAPDHGDPPPLADGQPAPPGRCPRLWEHEVVELFLLGEDQRYLEVEVGPGGHQLVLRLHGERRVVDDAAAVAATFRRAAGRWRAEVALDEALIPAGWSHLNAYAIHGLDPARRYLAWQPAGGAAPDFHRLEAFAALAALRAAAGAISGGPAAAPGAWSPRASRR
jgi:hypothetical protein